MSSTAVCALFPSMYIFWILKNLKFDPTILRCPSKYPLEEFSSSMKFLFSFLGVERFTADFLVVGSNLT